MDQDLIVPCGMNGAICASYLASWHESKSKGIRIPYCTGFRPRNERCAFLKKRCSLLFPGKVQFCYQCGDFPCDHLITIDKRYRARYRMSMIENLEFIRRNGMEAFLRDLHPLPMAPGSLLSDRRWVIPRMGPRSG
jgi:hypothetical protein